MTGLTAAAQKAPAQGGCPGCIEIPGIDPFVLRFFAYLSEEGSLVGEAEAEVAGALGVHVSAIRRAIAELVTLGWLTPAPMQPAIRSRPRGGLGAKCSLPLTITPAGVGQWGCRNRAVFLFARCRPLDSEPCASCRGYRELRGRLFCSEGA